jgi:trk system potassium uptake protein TrkA
MNNNKKQFAVLGLGKFGQSILKTLISKGCEVLGCDVNTQTVNEMSAYATHVIKVDVTDEGALDSLGIGNFDVVIIAVGGGFEASLISAMIAKEKGSSFILVKANSIRQKKILESIGVDKVVLPEREMGEKIALSFLSSGIIDYIRRSDRYDIFEIAPIKEWVGKKIKDVNIRKKYNLNIIAIERSNKFIISINSEDIILKDDVIIVIGEESGFAKLRS